MQEEDQRAKQPRQPLDGSSIAIVANGFADGPSTALRDWLVARKTRRVITINHPLVPEDGSRHQLREWQDGVEVQVRSLSLPSRPPLTYPLDLVYPLWPPAVDIWFGFNALACLRGLAARRLGRAERVVYWTIDFVEARFGAGLLTRAYEALDSYCCKEANAIFEISEASMDARAARHGGRRLAPTRVVPMGAWTGQVPSCDTDSWRAQKVMYMGHLVERQGVDTLIDSIGLLARDGHSITAEIIGRGPLETDLRARALKLGLADQVHFHGFVESHREVERILASGSVAVAPYRRDQASFTRFADPGKLKAYLGAGLPIVLTDVPPNAAELVSAGAAEIVPDNSRAIADGLLRVLADRMEFERRRAGALRLADQYDWETILAGAVRFAGLEP